jgi:hypothetical protein
MRLPGIPDPTSRRWRIVALVLVMLGVATVVSTYRVFNNFYDEPAHIAAGMEWLSRGSFTLEPQHPPLSRVASAFLPWISGAKSHGNTHLYTEGRLILGRGEQYQRMLTRARLGHLPFFVVLAFVVWVWTRRLSDERTATIAVGLVAANPNILAHAGIAGTDIGPAAMMPAALLAWTLWIVEPTVRRSVILGATLALCGLTKFSAGAYWVIAALLVAIAYTVRHPDRMLFIRGARRLFRPMLIAFGTASLVTWAAYRFSVGPVGGLTLPAPEFWIGLRDFFRHGTGGHPGYLFGEVKLGGWWYYDLIALLVKTPVPLLVLCAVGVWLSVRARRTWLATDPTATRADDEAAMLRIAAHVCIIAVLTLAIATPVDIGVRLDLPVYAGFSILGAIAASHGLASGIRWARTGVLVLAAWTVAIPIAAHPDHIAYFNVFAGREPAKVLVDSNLDWGQDLSRLRDAVNEIGMDSIRVHYFGTAEFAAVGLERARRLRPNERATGWVAASETFYAGVWADSALNWLRAYEPVARVGTSIRLYHIAPTP